ncbi:hypothetical protein FGO68_gene11249 [Halteria grandinella]|uniref:Uncharacterized protein n=1 Tax=Halteria grandinella TaxID=5974 RepID=A0A8J8P1V3_HALGN|nr:hypothetical protein FGO68_gene11249 [Halteria grandinella]
MHHGDIKPENIFLSHDEHDRFLFVTTDSGSLIQLDNSVKEKKYQPTTYTPLYSSQKYKDSVKDRIPLTYNELMEEDKHQLYLTLKMQATRFEQTEFTKLILSLFSRLSTIEELYLHVISGPSIALTFSQLHLVDSNLPSNKAMAHWFYFEYCLDPWFKEVREAKFYEQNIKQEYNYHPSRIFERDEEETRKFIKFNKFFVDCHFDDVFYRSKTLPEELREKWGIQWNMSLEQYQNITKNQQNQYGMRYQWRPIGVILTRLRKNQDMKLAQEALRQVAAISESQVHLKKLMRSFPYLIEQDISKVSDPKKQDQQRLMLIQLYQYTVSLVIDEVAKGSFQNQFEVYSNSFLNPVHFPSLDELRDPSFILDSNNFPQDYISDLETEEDFIIRIRQTSGSTLLTTFKIVQMCLNRGKMLFQDFLELIGRYSVQHIVYQAEANTEKEQLSYTSSQMINEYLNFSRIKNVHSRTLWVSEQLGDKLLLKGQAWTIQSLKSPENAAQHIYNSHIQLFYEQLKRNTNYLDFRHKEFLFLGGDQAVLNYILYKPRVIEEQEQSELVFLFLLNQLLYDIGFDYKTYIEPFGTIEKIEVVKDNLGRVITAKPKGDYVPMSGSSNCKLTKFQLLCQQQDSFISFARSLDFEQFCPRLRYHIETYLNEQKNKSSLDLSNLQALLKNIQCDPQLCIELTQKYPEQSDPHWNPPSLFANQLASGTSNLWTFFSQFMMRRNLFSQYKHPPQNYSDYPSFKHQPDVVNRLYVMDMHNHKFARIQYQSERREGYLVEDDIFSIEKKLHDYIENRGELDFEEMRGYIREMATISEKQLLLKRIIFEGILDLVGLIEDKQVRSEAIGLIQYAIEYVVGHDREQLRKELKNIRSAIIAK